MTRLKNDFTGYKERYGDTWDLVLKDENSCPPQYHNIEYPEDVDFTLVEAFIVFCYEFLTFTEDSIASEVNGRVRFYDWQVKYILEPLLATNSLGKFIFFAFTLLVPKKNGKSYVACALILFLLLVNPEGWQGVVSASSREQADDGIFKPLLDTVRKSEALLMELEALDGLLRYKDKRKNSVAKLLSSDAKKLDGKKMDLILMDEIQAYENDEAYKILSNGQSSKRNPKRFVTSTLGERYDSKGNDTLIYSVFQYGIDVCKGIIEDKGQCFVIWCCELEDDQIDLSDPEIFANCNPAWGTIKSIEQTMSNAKQQDKTERSAVLMRDLNKFISSDDKWLDLGAFGKLYSEEEIPLGSDICVGFDGSRSDDNTAIVIGTVTGRPHLQLYKLWGNFNKVKGYRIPEQEVLDTLKQLHKDYNVKYIYCDPNKWYNQLTYLSTLGLPIVEYPTKGQPIIKATLGFESAVYQQTFTWGTPNPNNNKDIEFLNKKFEAHVENAVIKTNPNTGESHIYKAGTQNKIDAVIAGMLCVMAINEIIPILFNKGEVVEHFAPTPEELAERRAKREQEEKEKAQNNIIYITN